MIETRKIKEIEFDKEGLDYLNALVDVISKNPSLKVDVIINDKLGRKDIYEIFKNPHQESSATIYQIVEKNVFDEKLDRILQAEGKDVKVEILNVSSGIEETNENSDQVNNLVSILEGYFNSGGYHLNVNILNRETLQEAYDNPDLYPNLTIRVSGYAVNFANLTDEQKREVISRTFHDNK